MLLKRLSDALEHGDRVYAVIKGSAVNNDGSRKAGFTAPSVPGQAEAISEALAVAGVDARTVSLVQAHGTGTQLGDPIEIAALKKAFGNVQSDGQFCSINSIKANIGHLECAAGVASLIAAVMALRHGILPPACNFNRANPQISFERTPFLIRTAPESWERRPRRCGVSNFGIGGTNAHVVLEEAAPAVEASEMDRQTPLLLPVSARSMESLEQLCAAYEQRLTLSPAGPIVRAAALRRTHHDKRVAVCGETVEDLIAGLQRWRERSNSFAIPPGRLAFVYPGQGGQWSGMGRGLTAQSTVFREAIEKCAAALLNCGGPDVLPAFTGRDAFAADDNDIALIQACVWTLQCALTQLWRSWGIHPDSVVGHSMGELAAAWASGALTLDVSARVIVERGRLLAQAARTGGMLSLDCGSAELRALLNGDTDVSIAARNAPCSAVISGSHEAISRLQNVLDARRFNYRVLRTSGVAGHSPQIRQFVEPLRMRLADLRPGPSKIPMVSTVTGGMIAGENLTAEYWSRNLADTVEFASAARQLIRDGHTHFLEISPHPTLLGPVEACGDSEGTRPVVLSSMRREQCLEWSQLFASLGTLYMSGRPVRWDGVYPGAAPWEELPGYPWNRQRCWIEASSRPSPAAPIRSWEREVAIDNPAFLIEHRIRDVAIMPAAAFIMFLCDSADAQLSSLFEIRELRISEAMPVHPDCRYRLRIEFEDRGAGNYQFSISSQDRIGEKTWIQHAAGSLLSNCNWSPSEISVQRLQDTLGDEISADVHYASAAMHGIHYGPGFQTVSRVLRDQAEAVVELTSAHGAVSGHPGVFDGCLQAIQALLPGLWVPVRFERLRMERSALEFARAHAKLIDRTATRARASLRVFDANGKIVAECDSIELAALETPKQCHAFYAIDWTSQPVPPPSVRNGRWLLIAEKESEALAEALRRELLGHGNDATIAALQDSDELITSHSGVVYLAASRPDFDENVCSSLLDLAKLAIARRDPPRLWLITTLAQPTPGVDCRNISAAPLWGMRRTIATEHPDLRATAIDIGGIEGLSNVARELLADGNENEIAFRSGQRWVARLEQLQDCPAIARNIKFRPDATYLITGGFGALGLLTAEWLIREGAGHVALIGRQPHDSIASRITRPMRSVIGDVSSPSSLTRAIEEIESAMPPIKGVFHAAGVLDDSLLANLTACRFRSVLRAKAGGAWNLHNILADRDLDFFVLYSSAADLIGSPGQANHAAANSFLDALAHYRRSLHLPALSVNWGPWGEAGKAAGHTASMLRSRGLESLGSEEAFKALEHLLERGWAQTGVMKLDFEKWAEHYPAAGNYPYFSRLRDRSSRGNVANRVPLSREDIAQKIVRMAGRLCGIRKPWSHSIRHCVSMAWILCELLSCGTTSSLSSTCVFRPLPCGAFRPRPRWLLTSTSTSTTASPERK